ncbi:MAG: biotin/lipoyl-binding protein, partial [Terriglobales bacterium]
MAEDINQRPLLERVEAPPIAPPRAEPPAAVPATTEPPKTEGERSWVRRVSRRRSKSGRLMLIIALLAVLVGAFFLWRYFASYQSTDDAQVDVHLYPVSARVSGYVIKVNVNDNQFVEKGTVLVEIDPRDCEVAVEKARADLASAEATARSLNITVPVTSVSTSSQLSFSASDVEGARAGVVAAEKQHAASHAQVEQAEANDVKAQDDLKRYKLLVDKQEISQQIYDQALAAARASTANVAAAHANQEAATQAIQQARSR